jgi:hypothetical protein
MSDTRGPPGIANISFQNRARSQACTFPRQKPIPSRVYGNLPGYAEGCRNVEANKVQAGLGMLPRILQQRPCFSLAGGRVIETGSYLDECFLAYGVAGEEVHSRHAGTTSFTSISTAAAC